MNKIQWKIITLTLYICSLMFVSFTFGYDLIHDIMHDVNQCKISGKNGCSTDGLVICMFFTLLIGGIMTIFQPEMSNV